MVGITHLGTSDAIFTWDLAFLWGVVGFRGVDLAGALGLAGELVGVDPATAAWAGLPLRRVPAVNTLSRYL